MKNLGINLSTFRLERTLHFQFGDSETTGVLFIGDIRWIEEKNKWACHWSLSHVHPEIGKTYGSDPLDALVKAIDFLSILIRGSEADGLVVWWEQRNDHAGLLFPLSEDRAWGKVPPNWKEGLPSGLQKDGDNRSISQ
jgi:hypothetical protein